MTMNRLFTWQFTDRCRSGEIPRDFLHPRGRIRARSFEHISWAHDGSRRRRRRRHRQLSTRRFRWRSSRVSLGVLNPSYSLELPQALWRMSSHICWQSFKNSSEMDWFKKKKKKKFFFFFICFKLNVQHEILCYCIQPLQVFWAQLTNTPRAITACSISAWPWDGSTTTSTLSTVTRTWSPFTDQVLVLLLPDC